MSDQVDNQVDNQMNNQMSDQVDNQVDNQMDTQTNNNLVSCKPVHNRHHTNKFEHNYYAMDLTQYLT